MNRPIATSLPETPPSHGKRRKVFTAAFTLVELLAVIAVIVMLLSFTLPLMRGGNPMTKAGWDIAGVIEQARAYAQSQNTYVWLAFHDGDASGTNRVSVFALASLDGTRSPYTTQGQANTTNVTLIDKVRFFENVSYASSNSYATHFSTYGGNPGGTAVTESNITTASDADLLTADMPKNSGNSGAKFPLASVKVLLIDPSGSISMPNSSTMANYFDLRLVPMRGTSVSLADGGAPNDSAIVRIYSLGGRVKVIRYGVTEAPEEP